MLRMTTFAPAPREVVAAEVRSATARRRISQAKIAAHLGMSPTALSRRFCADLPFDIDELAAVAAFLDVPITDLVSPIDTSRIRWVMRSIGSRVPRASRQSRESQTSPAVAA